MKREREIIIIGGTACGPKAAARARRCDPHAGITLIEQSEHLSSATCGFPYRDCGSWRRDEGNNPYPPPGKTNQFLIFPVVYFRYALFPILWKAFALDISIEKW
ncbi:MAG: hypothetical protein V1800_00635 [Candidatus Latescibacterota bacterium]